MHGEGIWGSRRIAQFILNSGTTWSWLASFMPQLLYHRGRTPIYPLNRRMGGSQGRCGRWGEKKSLFPYPESKHDSSVACPWPSHNTDYATLDTNRLFWKGPNTGFINRSVAQSYLVAFSKWAQFLMTLSVKCEYLAGCCIMFPAEAFALAASSCRQCRYWIQRPLLFVESQNLQFRNQSQCCVNNNDTSRTTSC